MKNPEIWEIAGVRIDTIDGRPQLVLDLVNAAGEQRVFTVDREAWKVLTETIGHSQVADEFFNSGKDLQ
jgi:hypothetical protein